MPQTALRIRAEPGGPKSSSARTAPTPWTRTGWAFLDHQRKAVPYRIHTILTAHGIQFAEQPRNRNTA